MRRSTLHHLRLPVGGALLALALGLPGARAEPVFVDIATGWGHACALDRDGAVWCWGVARLNGQDADSDEPAQVQGLGKASAIYAGLIGTCAVEANGRVLCWGIDYQSAEASADDALSAKPFEIKGLPPVVQIGIGFVHFCALSIVGDVYCWGQNPRGELGTVPHEYSPDPIKVQGLGKVVSIGIGVNNSCAVESRGGVKCWGTDDPGGVTGKGFKFNSSTPQTIQGIRNMRAVANGRNYVCGLNKGGGVQCWGSASALPKQASPKILLPISQMDVGVFKGCVVYLDGTLQCWNYDDTTPRVDARLKNVKKISVGADENSCALLTDGSVHCLDKAGAYRKITLPRG